MSSLKQRAREIEVEAVTVEQGDIIQITDESHAWFPALLVVGEVKSWGVTACVLMPQSNDGSSPPSQAWNRLKNGTYTVVGRAEFIPG